jgi:hypothetical protein
MHCKVVVERVDVCAVDVVADETVSVLGDIRRPAIPFEHAVKFHNHFLPGDRLRVDVRFLLPVKMHVVSRHSLFLISEFV